jgi:SPP1 family predicted phage head-tail adaptor
MFLYIPTTTTSKGSAKKTYPENGEQIFCRFRTFGGTETTVNGVLVVENTATVETWYRPDIKSDCVIKDVSGLSYEILGTPEDIEQRHQFLHFKVRAIKGGV